MARKLFFALGVLALATLFALSSGTTSNAQGADCIGNCIGGYITCTNSSGESPNCDEQYDQCVEGCINRQ